MSNKPNTIDKALHQGNAYKARGLYSEAAESYQQAIAHKPDSYLASHAQSAS